MLGRLAGRRGATVLESRKMTSGSCSKAPPTKNRTLVASAIQLQVDWNSTTDLDGCQSTKDHSINVKKSVDGLPEAAGVSLTPTLAHLGSRRGTHWGHPLRVCFHNVLATQNRLWHCHIWSERASQRQRRVRCEGCRNPSRQTAALWIPASAGTGDHV